MSDGLILFEMCFKPPFPWLGDSLRCKAKNKKQESKTKSVEAFHVMVEKETLSTRKYFVQGHSQRLCGLWLNPKDGEVYLVYFSSCNQAAFIWPRFQKTPPTLERHIRNWESSTAHNLTTTSLELGDWHSTEEYFVELSVQCCTRKQTHLRLEPMHPSRKLDSDGEQDSGDP